MLRTNAVTRCKSKLYVYRKVSGPLNAPGCVHTFSNRPVKGVAIPQVWDAV